MLDFENEEGFSVLISELLRPVFRRGDAFCGFEGSIERGERAEAGIHGNRQDGQAGLIYVCQDRFGVGEAVFAEEACKVSVAHPAIYERP